MPFVWSNCMPQKGKKTFSGSDTQRTQPCQKFISVNSYLSFFLSFFFFKQPLGLSGVVGFAQYSLLHTLDQLLFYLILGVSSILSQFSNIFLKTGTFLPHVVSQYYPFQFKSPSHYQTLLHYLCSKSYTTPFHNWMLLSASAVFFTP